MINKYILLFSLISYNVSMATDNSCTFKEMFYKSPEQAGRVRDMLYYANCKKKTSQSDEQGDQKEEDQDLEFTPLLLRGAPGNGKTLQVFQIAKESHAPIAVLMGGNVQEPTEEQDINKMRDHVEEALDTAGYKVPLVVIEEVERLPAHALLFLQKILKSGEYKHDVQFACTTNAYDKLGEEFIRCFKNNVADFYNPTEDARREYIHQFFARKMIQLSHEQVEYITQRTNGFDIRSLEEIPLNLYTAHGTNAQKYTRSMLNEAINKQKDKLNKNKNTQKWWDSKLFTDTSVTGKVRRYNPIKIDENFFVSIVPQHMDDGK
ncbi:hypothetical protein A3F06_03960 [candidate division TM6 bacterium RIFCSPHIGHO2_12_FULL_36_22]|nr:MAG: hypothetical protein A3F06_03960 [candidate division TM6 bacterium RIFCSPHIGHO2_12_FULL_36_22]